MEKLAKRKIRVFYYVTGLLLLLTISVALSVPYFISVRKQFDMMVAESKTAIFGEKKQILAERVERVVAEIEAIRETVYNEYQTLGQAQCALLSTLKLSTKDIIDGFDPNVTKHTPRFVRHNTGIGLAVYDRESQKILWTDEEALVPKLLESFKGGEHGPTDDFPVWAVSNLDGNSVVAIFAVKEAIDTIAKNRSIAIVRSLRFSLNQYIWINGVRNYSGGPGYAVRVVHPSLVGDEEVLLSTEDADPVGNLAYKEELEGVLKHGKVYFTYQFKKIHSDEVTEKLAYAQLYKPFDWIVCTGIHTDDMLSLVAKREAGFNRAFKNQISSYAKIISIISLLYIGMMVLFERRLTSMVNLFIGKLKEDEAELRKEKNKLDDAYRELQRVAYSDFLTGLLNRRAMYERLEEEVARAQREGLQFCIVLADIDHFKSVNDTYGHNTGDVVLKAIADIFRQNIRPEDSASRWGGEEFLVLVLSSSLKEGLVLAETLRQTVESTTIYDGDIAISATITLGVVEYAPGKSFDSLIKEADFYLYAGKKRQKNCVMSRETTENAPSGL
ncbi:MAG: sensor domain-containing diguanylate cyclase [Desulfovibrio sp.]|nr:sensor domain-containing diguanylate cyclase [Desulfovibrio sp.]